MRRCTRCREEKPIEDFYRQVTAPELRMASCKDCYHQNEKAKEEIKALGFVYEPQEWMDLSLCAIEGHDPELWFSENRLKRAEAEEVCARCPVAQQCGQLRLRSGARDGVWGDGNFIGRNTRQIQPTVRTYRLYNPPVRKERDHKAIYRRRVERGEYSGVRINAR